MLFIFLCANIATGVVNLTVNTISAGSWDTFTILYVYALALSGIAFYLGWHFVHVKLHF